MSAHLSWCAPVVTLSMKRSDGASTRVKQQTVCALNQSIAIADFLFTKAHTQLSYDEEREPSCVWMWVFPVFCQQSHSAVQWGWRDWNILLERKQHNLYLMHCNIVYVLLFCWKIKLTSIGEPALWLLLMLSSKMRKWRAALQRNRVTFWNFCHSLILAYETCWWRKSSDHSKTGHSCMGPQIHSRVPFH